MSDSTSDASISSAFNPLFEGPIDERPLLAHYTSMLTLEKILASGSLWFSNPLYMNDHDEIRFGMLWGRDLTEDSAELKKALETDVRRNTFLRAFEHYFGVYEEKHLLDTYVFCLSEHAPSDNDGLLSMWRGYGGNGRGAAIVFDSGRVGESEDQLPLEVRRIRYGDNEERRHWLRETIAHCAKIIAGSGIPDDKLYIGAHHLIERIKRHALFSKHKGFMEEQEWRVVYFRERDPGDLLSSMLSYWNGPNGVEPKLQFRLTPKEVARDAPESTLWRLVDRIILGPMHASELGRSSVKRMLEQLKRPELVIRVFASSIPFRAT